MEASLTNCSATCAQQLYELNIKHAYVLVHWLKVSSCNVQSLVEAAQPVEGVCTTACRNQYVGPGTYLSIVNATCTLGNTV